MFFFGRKNTQTNQAKQNDRNAELFDDSSSGTGIAGDHDLNDMPCIPSSGLSDFGEDFDW